MRRRRRYARSEMTPEALGLFSPRYTPAVTSGKKQRYIWAASVILGVGVVGAALCAVNGEFGGTVGAGATLLDAIGFLLTATGVSVAIAIYRAQAISSEGRNQVVDGHLLSLAEKVQALGDGSTASDIANDIDAIQQSKAGDPLDTLDDTVTSTFLSEDELVRLGVPREKAAGVSVYPGSEIPLKPLTLLREALNGNEEWSKLVEGTPDRITPSRLSGYRADGRGPNSWFITIPTSPGSGPNPESRRGRAMWRVSMRSGQVERLIRDTPDTADASASG